MTGRERLTAIMHRQPADRLSWTTLVDWTTLHVLPEALQARGGMAFYEHVGCDVLLLEAWGAPCPWKGPRLQWPADVQVSSRQEEGTTIEEWHSPAGTLTTGARGRIHKFPVETEEELRIYRCMWEGAEYVAGDDAETANAIDSFIGDSGLHVRYWYPSVVQALLQFITGIEGFYYLLADCRAEMEDLMAVMHTKQLQAFEIQARQPMDTVILPENTSTTLISPELYNRYSVAQVRDFVDIVHGEGKVALVHMCGLIRDLLPMIKETGLDGIHGLTPPQVGNTPWECALDVLGEDTVIVGVLDPDTFCLGSPASIQSLLDTVYTPRLRRANFCLWCSADGLQVPLENFLAVKEWMKRQ